MPHSLTISVAVVDDDESVCRSLGRLLRAAEMESVTFASAEAFLASPRPRPFDCLVFDIRLGGMSGLDLGRRLAQEGNTIPIIFITAHDDEGTQAEAKSVGCAAYFRKTDSGSTVLETIRRLAA